MTNNQFWARIRAKLGYFLEYMIWLITKRKIVREIHKLRWKDEGFWVGNLERYKRGVVQDELVPVLYANQFANGDIFKFLIELRKKIDPQYIRSFTPKIEDVIERCLEEKYLKPSNKGPKQCLVVTEKGHQLISRIYYWEKILGNPYVKAILISILTGLTAIYITNYITKKVDQVILKSNEQQEEVLQSPR